ncbi:GcrA family cell cycle regulator [Roseococcus microcysteis]|uniref:GcrA family cell cycle regulator n=1 Tax=Roseococcus microcysteis TaxID=2771361 RepID=UPI00168B6820|nr:GcrA family cell cycle regulator [Roseococcus microcysteis]
MTDWTPEMVAKLRELLSDGYSTTEIARRMGLTKGQVTGKAHRLRLTDQGMPVPRGGQKRGAAAVAEAAARAAAPRVVLPKAQSVGKSEQVVAHAAALAAGLGAARSMAATPAIARTVQELAAKVRASAMPRVAPMRAGEGCRYPLWGEERRPALRRFCDQPRRTGRDGVPNSAYCPACHALTHVAPSQQRLEDKRLQWSVASAFARAAGR